MKQQMIGWRWHQLDHMQIIYTSLQTDNYVSTSSLNFYRLDALPDAKPVQFATKLGCMLTGTQGCEQLATTLLGVEPVTFF